MYAHIISASGYCVMCIAVLILNSATYFHEMFPNYSSYGYIFIGLCNGVLVVLQEAVAIVSLHCVVLASLCGKKATCTCSFSVTVAGKFCGN